MMGRVVFCHAYVLHVTEKKDLRPMVFLYNYQVRTRH
jgi:hypothetical protein